MIDSLKQLLGTASELFEARGRLAAAEFDRAQGTIALMMAGAVAAVGLGTLALLTVTALLVFAADPENRVDVLAWASVIYGTAAVALGSFVAFKYKKGLNLFSATREELARDRDAVLADHSHHDRRYDYERSRY